jgi:hypothetical protein
MEIIPFDKLGTAKPENISMNSAFRKFVAQLIRDGLSVRYGPGLFTTLKLTFVVQSEPFKGKDAV